MSKHARRGLSIAAGVGVSGALFYMALRGVDLSEVAGLFIQADPVWVPLLVLMPLADLWVRAVRWRLILAPLAASSTPRLFQLEAVGLALNNILFLRLGEFARAYVTGRELGAPVISVLATIFVERLCDTVALLTLFTLSAFGMAGLIDGHVRFWAAAVAVGLALVLVALAAGDAWIKRRPSVLHRLTGYPRLRLLVEEAMIGGRCLRHGHATARIVVLSLCLWLADAGVFWAGARALGFSPTLDFLQSITVVASAAAASALPAVPGAFGNFEAAVRLILKHFGYGESLAVGYGALVHLCMYLTVTVTGLASLYRLGYTLGGLRRAASRRGAP